MTQIRLSEAAELLGVSADTVRRWVDAGKLSLLKGSSPAAVDGGDLARFAAERSHTEEDGSHSSARNRMRGLVTRVVRDTVMAQVDIQAGPYRIVSLISREAADELDLQPGSIAVASIKATNVVIERP